jgi:hypothetical protein
VHGSGYEPDGHVVGPANSEVRELAIAAVRCAEGRAVLRGGRWAPVGDPMEVALHVLALRTGLDLDADASARPERYRITFDPARRRTLVVVGDRESASVFVTGAPDAVLPLCRSDHLAPDVEDMAGRGLRVLAVAAGPLPDGAAVDAPADVLERDLRLLGLVGLQDPPREGVAEAVRSCRNRNSDRCRGEGGRIGDPLSGDHDPPGRKMPVELLSRDAGGQEAIEHGRHRIIRAGVTRVSHARSLAPATDKNGLVSAAAWLTHSGPRSVLGWRPALSAGWARSKDPGVRGGAA